MKTLSVKQPWASLIVEGIKDIENRTWKTKFRGRVLIHAGLAKSKISYYDYEPFKSYWKQAGSHCGFSDCEMKEGLSKIKFDRGLIIGSVEIVDCVINHESIWAEKTPMAYMGKLTIECQAPIYNWVLANPILFPEPIPAKGKLSFWDYPNILAEPEEKDGELFCHCQLPVKEINQVTGGCGDYRCVYCGGKWYK
jgi:hypothetical protein